MELCKDLAIASLRKNITILCYEKEEIFCHRFYIKKDMRTPTDQIKQS